MDGKITYNCVNFLKFPTCEVSDPVNPLLKDRSLHTETILKHFLRDNNTSKSSKLCYKLGLTESLTRITARCLLGAHPPTACLPTYCIVTWYNEKGELCSSKKIFNLSYNVKLRDLSYNVLKFFFNLHYYTSKNKGSHSSHTTICAGDAIPTAATRIRAIVPVGWCVLPSILKSLKNRN